MLWTMMCLGTLTLQPVWAQEGNRGKELAEEARDAYRGFGSETIDLEMTLIDAQGGRTVRRMKLLSTEVEDDGNRMRMEVVWPADVNGTRMLTWGHKNRRDDQWLYLPALSTVKRIAGGNIAASFMGSEFSFEDFTTAEVEKFEYDYIGEDRHRGREVEKYTRVSTDKKSGYARQVVYHDAEYKAPIRVDYYDRKDELLKVCEFTGFTEVAGYWGPGRIEMENVQTGKSSVIVNSNRKIGEDLDPSLFDSASLGD